MGKLDEIKEEIGWLKVWLGIGVAAGFGMAGWFVANYESAPLVWLIADAIGLMVAMAMVFWANRKAVRNIRLLRDIGKDD